MKILVINCGSSSVKYKVFQFPSRLLLASGAVEKIGEGHPFISYETASCSLKKDLDTCNHEQAITAVMSALTDPAHGVIKDYSEISGIGHRVVHGGEGFDKSVIIDDDVIKKIERFSPLAPLHNPHNLAGIRAALKFAPESVQVASFDTAFHATLPPEAYIYGLPYEYYEKYRVRRYGFHGTSHRYVAERAASLMGKRIDETNLISCHLGNGSSVCAVKGGISVDTSMGLTPLEGLMMGTRSGDVDPGILLFLMDVLGADRCEMDRILNKESGVLGLSGVSNDFRRIMDVLGKNEKAALALNVYAYRIKKYVGSYMAVLGRTDAVVFTAGVGENIPLVRSAALSGLEQLGIEIDDAGNIAAVGREAEIGKPSSSVRVFVIPTDEELCIAIDTFPYAGCLSQG